MHASGLVVENLSKRYPTRAEPLDVLRGVSCRLAPGENMAILGPSGCGKSTLLQIIGTLDTPSGGSISLANEDPFSLQERELAEFRNRRIGFVFQDHHLLPQCSTLENVLLPAMANGATTAESIDRARQLLDRVGLSQRLDHLPSELSGGERQRAAIARALINRPALILADEPTGNLDRATAASIARLLVDVQHDGSTMMIAVTHSLELAAMFQRRVTLDGGQLQADGGA